jgi:small subunit ribosomal protein S16
VAVKIRLKRMGKIRAPFYRIVVADSRTKRDGRVIEQIGKYHPKSDPSFIEVDSERVQYWLGVGAQPSEPVAAILRLTGDWQKHKGQPAPGPLLEARPRRDKTDIFNEALQEAHNEPKSEAVTPRRTARKAASAPEAAPKATTSTAETTTTGPTAEPTAETSAVTTQPVPDPVSPPADETPAGVEQAVAETESIGDGTAAGDG